MVNIDKKVGDLAAAYQNNVPALMKRAGESKDIFDMLALNIVTTKQKEAKAALAQGMPDSQGTVYDSMEKEAVENQKELMGQGLAEVAKNTSGTLANKQRQNPMPPNQAGAARPQMNAAQGGIVGFRSGGGIAGFDKGGKVTDAQIAKYLAKYNLPDNAYNRDLAIKDITKVGEKAYTPIPVLGGDGERLEGTIADMQEKYAAAKKSRASGLPAVPTDPVVPTPGAEVSGAAAVDSLADANIALNKKEAGEKVAAEEKAKAEAAANADPLAGFGLNKNNMRPETAEIDYDPAAELQKKLAATGLGSLQDRDKVVTDARASSDLYLDRAGAKKAGENQEEELRKLTERQQDPAQLRKNALMRGLMAASGGGGFAAVGTGIMNEQEAQGIAERDALHKKFDIQNKFLSLDLDVASKGLESGDKALGYLTQERTVLADMYNSTETSIANKAIASANQKFESNKSEIANQLKVLTLEVQKDIAAGAQEGQQMAALLSAVNKITQESSVQLSKSIDEDTSIMQLKLAMTADPSEENVETYKNAINAKIIEHFQLRELAGTGDLLETVEAQLYKLLGIEVPDGTKGSAATPNTALNAALGQYPAKDD